MKKEEVIKDWLESAKRDRKTAEILFDNKRHDQCLFYCHLYIEKLLKAVYVKRLDRHPPYTHKLTKLALKAKLPLDQSRTDQLDEITTFNVEARYDSCKSSFYKKATLKYTQKYLKISEELYQWLLSLV